MSDTRGCFAAEPPGCGIALTLVGCLIAGVSGTAGDWNSFRGPFGTGHASESESSSKMGVPLQWSETNNVGWKTPLPHRGWSSPVVCEGRVWTTAATLDGKEFFSICANLDSGELTKVEKLFTCDIPEPLGNSVNCYATPTSAVEPGRVYVHFGSYGTACLDAETSEPIWKRDDLKCRHYRGPASSPVIFHDMLILTMDGVDLQYVVALDKRTGKTVWKTDRSVEWNDEHVPGQMARDGDLRKGHSTPLIVDYKGKPLMLTGGAKAAYGYDPVNGREIWRVQYNAWSAAPMPLLGDGLAYFITGLGKTELLALRLDGRGDVTESHVAWRLDSMVAKTASPILADGLFYMISDDGMLTCLNPATGDQVWRQRIPGNYSASPIFVDGHLFFFSQQGKTTLLKPGNTCDIVRVNSLDAGFMASPAVAGKTLILRTKTHLYRIDSPF